MSENGWIGVDLDGTLAEYTGWQGPEHIGEPIKPMLDRVNEWLADGKEVKIFTASVSHDGTSERVLEAAKAKFAIEGWILKHAGKVIPITNVKDYGMIELWDDRAVQVIPNTGLRADGKAA